MPEIKSVTHIDNVRLSDDGRSVVIIDQSLLPNETKYLSLSSREALFEAIKSLRVRGAPAIGIFAGYAIYVLAQSITASYKDDFMRELNEQSRYLESSRPTAVNLGWALRRMCRAAGSQDSVASIRAAMLRECRAIHDEDIRMCMAISENGLSLLHNGDGLLTHCNAGPLATSRYGTALGPMLLGTERGMSFHVFADETRPLLQGARLTSYELSQAGVDVTLICDNMASIVMKNGWVNACLVGCDRVARNGDTANKIGTSGVAILAKHYNIPFYVLGPTSTIDMDCKTGADIAIEQRDPDEIREKWYEKPMALENVKCYNPAFDVTDNSLISAIITEKGVCRAPYDVSIPALFSSESRG